MGWDDEKRARRAIKEQKAIDRKAKRHGGELPSYEKSRLSKISGVAKKAVYNSDGYDEEYSDWD